MNTDSITTKFVSRYEASNFLKVSVKTIDRLIRSDRIKAFKLGKRVLIYYETLTEENINSIRPRFKNGK